MLSSVLRSPKAIAVNIAIMRTFVRMRKLAAPPATDADVAILAGDIGVGLGALPWVDRCFPDKPVIYVPGNHEYYHHDLNLIEAMKHEAPRSCACTR